MNSLRRLSVQERYKYDYVVIRVTPKVDRGEFINVGVIVSCPEVNFLEARIELDEQRLKVIDPSPDLETIKKHLEIIPLICKGGDDAGPIGKLILRERFHWLTSPRSTVIQTSPVHAGYCKDPAAVLENLMNSMVRLSRSES
jgi:hypothetical protein